MLKTINDFQFYLEKDSGGMYSFKGNRGNVGRMLKTDFDKLQKFAPSGDRIILLDGIAEIENVRDHKKILIAEVFKDIEGFK